MNFAHDTGLIFWRQMRLSLRNPVWTVISLLQPVMFLAFFGPLFASVFNRGLVGGVGNAYGYFVPGLLIQLGLFGSASVGFSIVSDWRYGVVDRLRVTMVSRLAILTGRVLRDVFVLLVQSVMLIGLGTAFGLRAPLAGIAIGLGFIALVAISLSALSYGIGLLTKSESVLASGLNLLIMPVILLSGIMLPLTVGPGWLQAIGSASPFRYIIDAMRQAYMNHYGGATMTEGLAVAAGMALVCVWLATTIFRHENAR
ncbi:MAG TPA: ABC transporter permease [Streptosporangiaceae bacterium]